MDKKKKVLLVDDDDFTREMYADILVKAEFEVIQAKDGLEGLDLATKSSPDVIFTGIIMPRMDGFALMESLKKNVATASIPVIISSHMGREEDQQRANKLGAKDFIVRDMTPIKEVVERIRKVFVTGGTYRLNFNPRDLDAQKLVRDFGLNANYQCMECNEGLIMKSELKDSKNFLFETKFICPNCGWEMK